MRQKSPDKNQPQDQAGGNAGGILSGLAGLVERLNELAETGAELRRGGEIHGGREGLKGIYGFTVKVGLGGQAPLVEPFGNIRADKATGQAVVEEIREPVVDLFDEKDHLLIVAEMPGIGAADVQLEVKDDVLTLSAAKGDKSTAKSCFCPATFPGKK